MSGIVIICAIFKKCVYCTVCFDILPIVSVSVMVLCPLCHVIKTI